jgi:aldose 1-epimerase
MDIDLSTNALAVTLTTAGGAVWRLEAIDGDRRVPLLRPPPSCQERPPGQAGCFPLVPFGNRIAGNRFEHGGRAYHLEPNTPWDEHSLHGDGWLGEWTLNDRDDRSASLAFSHAAGRDSPYAYRATQDIGLDDNAVRLDLAVENRGDAPLPFGLGWHPFFPLTPLTTLQARAQGFWTERRGWLPDQRMAPPPDLDFATPCPLPRHWVNNGFDGWDGSARIVWPEHELVLDISGAANLTRYFVFVSDAAFEPGYDHTYFCFEPMTHDADGHARVGESGLAVLAPGQVLAASIVLSWSRGIR